MLKEKIKKPRARKGIRVNKILQDQQRGQWKESNQNGKSEAE